MKNEDRYLLKPPKQIILLALYVRYFNYTYKRSVLSGKDDLNPAPR